EDVGLAVAMTGAARTLLLDELLARAPDFRPVLHVMRAGHRLELLIADHAVQDVGAGLEAENIVLERDRTISLAVEGQNLQFHLLALPGGSERTRPGRVLVGRLLH